MDAILHKPFTVKKLAECIGSFLTPSTMQETDMAKSVFVQASAAQDDVELLDAETIDRLLQMAQSGRRDFIDRILTLYQNHAPRVLADLHKAAERSEDIGAAAAAHTLTSMSLNMGAGRLAARLARIEAAARNSRTIPQPHELEQLRSLLEATTKGLVETFAPVSRQGFPPKEPVYSRRSRTLVASARRSSASSLPFA
jgi:HPt (histidine-containing phosphotransfer) domain-containing protein